MKEIVIGMFLIFLLLFTVIFGAGALLVQAATCQVDLVEKKTEMANLTSACALTAQELTQARQEIAALKAQDEMKTAEIDRLKEKDAQSEKDLAARDTEIVRLKGSLRDMNQIIIAQQITIENGAAQPVAETPAQTTDGLGWLVSFGLTSGALIRKAISVWQKLS